MSTNEVFSLSNSDLVPGKYEGALEFCPSYSLGDI